VTSAPKAPLALVTLAAALLAGPAARADVPPPDGYVESCTVEKRAAAGGVGCVACGDAYHGAPDACATALAGQGLERACRTRGASVWTEVWCKSGAGARPREVATPTVAGTPPAEKPGSCAAVPASDASLWALGVLALAAARRRR
jgi:MYXO-CTERM domain-containing protein